MSNLSTFYKPAITRADLGLGTANNVTFASIQNTPIGSTTRNSGAFTTLTANNGTLTASAPAVTIQQTWNNVNEVFHAFDITVNPTAALFGGSTGSILRCFRGTTNVFNINGGGFANTSTGFTTSSNAGIRLNNSISLFAGSDARTLDVREGTGSCALQVYNTFTSATNHERGFLKWSSNVFQIGTEKGSAGGSARALEFQTDGVTRMTIAADGSSVAFNPAVTFGQNVTVQSGRVLGVNQINLNASSTSTLALGTDSVIRWSSTSSFPSLRRSGTTLRVRLADDSGDAPLSCSSLTLSDNLTFGSGDDIVLSTTTGTKIGTATNQLLGFFNAAPVAQQAAVADATDAASTQARLNDLLARLRTLGLIAT